MIIYNTLPISLPNKVARQYIERREQALLEYRRHVPIGGDGKLQSLDPKEEERLREFDAEKWTSRAPRWDGKEFFFAPAGQPGCAYDLPARVANFLMEKYNKGSKYVCKMEGERILETCEKGKVPGGVQPIRPDLEDPLTYSSEVFKIFGKAGVIYESAGFAEPPAPYDPKEVAVPVNSVVPSKGAPVKPRPSADEPVLSRP